MYLLYSLLFFGLFVLGLPYLAFRCARDRGYATSLVERFRAPAIEPVDATTLWIHAVSVGEVITAATLLPALTRAFPDARIVVSVITVTGRQVADDKLRGVAAVFYCPFDLAVLVRRVVRRVRPRALLVVETELWPHLLREAKRAGAKTLIVGGRISDRSFPRYRAIRWFMKRVLDDVDAFCMQSERYRNRIEALGARPERVRVTGSLKFDAAPPPATGSPRIFPKDRRTLIAGSTLDPEEDLLLSLLSRLRPDAPDLFLVLAPRQPRRFDDVAELARRRGFHVVRRTEGGVIPAGADVLILDTLGELASLYAEADYVFVGGSIAPWGGHNIIEPASQSKPVLFGPHMQNFADIAALFLEDGAAVQVHGTAEMEAVLRDWIRHPERGRTLGERAARVIEDNRGACERTVALLRKMLA